MQSPTYAEFQTFNKVAAWIFSNAPQLASAPPSRSVEDLTIHNPLDIFQRFPNGAKQRTLESTSRAFRRFAAQVLADCQSKPQRKAAWAKVGVEVFDKPGMGQMLRLAGAVPAPEPRKEDPEARHRATLARDGDWFASQVDPAVWNLLADDIRQSGEISVRQIMGEHPEWADTDIQRAVEFSDDYLPRPLADLGVTVSGGKYRIEF